MGKPCFPHDRFPSDRAMSVPFLRTLSLIRRRAVARLAWRSAGRTRRAGGEGRRRIPRVGRRERTPPAQEGVRIRILDEAEDATACVPVPISPSNDARLLIETNLFMLRLEEISEASKICQTIRKRSPKNSPYLKGELG